MSKDKYLPKENIPKIEEIREIKSEIPTYEEFMKTYESDKSVENSYQDEYEAKITQGSQYGPGKENFPSLCSQIKSQLGYDLTCKISRSSDYFDSSKNYVGVIVYAVNGKFNWVFSAGREYGYIGKSFYMIVRNTDDLGSGGIGIGGSLFHGSVIKDEFGIDLSYNNNIICCGGFTYLNGKLRFNSYALNYPDQVGCNSDGSNELSYYEKRLVEHCFNEYKTKGSGSVIDIPSYLS